MPYPKKEARPTISIDSILGDIDPMQAAVMVLGGTAAACGIVPPMTRMLQMFSGGTDSGTLFGPLDALITPLMVFDLLNALKNGTTDTTEPTQLEARMKTLGLFCSGAVEACLMYQLASNPRVLETMLAVPGQILGAAGKIIP